MGKFLAIVIWLIGLPLLITAAMTAAKAEAGAQLVGVIICGLLVLIFGGGGWWCWTTTARRKG